MNTNPVLELGGKTYKTTLINGQIWMAENLIFPIEGSWIYNENPEYGYLYGRLYTWEAALKACPEGWHLPSDEEWGELINNLGGEEAAYNKMLDGGVSGMNIRFSGYRHEAGFFMSVERAADFWSSTEASPGNAWLRYLVAKKEKVFRSLDNKKCGFSVRYLKDTI